MIDHIQYKFNLQLPQFNSNIFLTLKETHSSFFYLIVHGNNIIFLSNNLPTKITHIFF